MSRIGRAPIVVPKGVSFEVKDGVAVVKGPKGEITAPVATDIAVEQQDGQLIVTRPSDSTRHKSLHGLTRALLNNAVIGVSEGFTKVLELRGVGYRAEATPKALNMALGYSHPVNLTLPEGLVASVANSTPTMENGYLAATITLTSHSKQILGDFAADVKGRRSVEPYKGKGLRYKGELVKRKQGKTEGKKK
jgi:large subunit ribosomal protein L6